MSWEINERRLVVRDGQAVPEGDGDERQWEAYLVTDAGDMTIVAIGTMYMGVSMRDLAVTTDGVTVQTDDLVAAVLALQRLQGISLPQEQAQADQQERWAAVVERACERLELGDDPVGTTLAAELRVNMLQVIEIASRAATISDIPVS